MTGQRTPRRFTLPWSVIEADLATALPDDYKEFVYHFGPGSFGHYLTVNMPGVANSFTELTWRARRLHSLSSSIGEPFARPFAQSLFPDAGGAFLFATTITGGNLYWITEPSDPAVWPIVIEDVGWFEWRGTLAELLLSVFTNTVEIEALGVEFDAVPQFHPSDGSFCGGRGMQLPALSRFAK